MEGDFVLSPSFLVFLVLVFWFTNSLRFLRILVPEVSWFLLRQRWQNSNLHIDVVMVNMAMLHC